MKKRLKRHRPTRTNTGGGKFKEDLGTGVNLWGVVRYQDDSTSIIVDSREDVKIGDVIAIPE